MVSNNNRSSTSILTMPKVNPTRYGLKSWRYQAPKLWNCLPDVARASSDFKTFWKLLANESILRLCSINEMLFILNITILVTFIAYSILFIYSFLLWHACKLASACFSTLNKVQFSVQYYKFKWPFTFFRRLRPQFIKSGEESTCIKTFKSSRPILCPVKIYLKHMFSCS